MNSDTWHQILKVLSQKSSITGIVAMVAVIFTLFGSELSPEHATSITGAIAALLSVLAIVIQPRPSGGHYTEKDYNPGDSYEEPGQPVRTFDGEKWS
jgi:uncharacterized membrane protein